MRLFLQAIRAAVVETLGISLVIWLLFGLPVWSLQWAAESRPQAPAVWTWLKSLPGEFKDITRVVHPSAEDRQSYTEHRLDFHSRAYRHAAAEHVRRVSDDIGGRPHS